MKKLKDIKAYIQGNIRYRLYYSKYNWLIPGYIREQIMARIRSMRLECFTEGSCQECGCTTTHLQMANKACDGKCYPVMVDKSKWEYMKKGNITAIDNSLWKYEENLFKPLVK